MNKPSLKFRIFLRFRIDLIGVEQFIYPHDVIPSLQQIIYSLKRYQHMQICASMWKVIIFMDTRYSFTVAL